MNGENGLLVYLFDQRTDSTVDQPAKKSLFAGYPKLAVEVHRGRQILDTDVYIYLSDESKPTKPRAYILYYIILYILYYIILYTYIYIYILGRNFTTTTISNFHLNVRVSHRPLFCSAGAGSRQLRHMNNVDLRLVEVPPVSSLD